MKIMQNVKQKLYVFWNAMNKKGLIEEKPDYLVCTCMGVMYSEICTAIQNGSTNFQALADIFMVGSGCSSCVQEINEILDNKLKS